MRAFLSVVAVGVLTALTAPSFARADDAELKQLRERVAALEAKLAAANRQIDGLKAELADLRAALRPTLAAAAKAAKDQAAKDLARFQGSWHVHWAVVKKEGGERELAGARHFVIEDDRLNEWIEGFKAGWVDAVITLDPSRSPGWIDLQVGGRTLKGLYKFTARGPVIILGNGDSDRPTDFLPYTGRDHSGRLTLVSDKR